MYGNSINNWINKMTNYRKDIHIILANQLCKLEMWANNSKIDDELGLYFIGIPFDQFL